VLWDRQVAVHDQLPKELQNFGVGDLMNRTGCHVQLRFASGLPGCLPPKLWILQSESAIGSRQASLTSCGSCGHSGRGAWSAPVN